jgi:hypothetical protein
MEDPAKAPPVKHSSLLRVPLETSTTNFWTPYHRTAARKHKMASHDDGLDDTMRVYKALDESVSTILFRIPTCFIISDKLPIDVDRVEQGYRRRLRKRRTDR